MQMIALQLDLGRQKETLDYIKSYVDFAVQCGYNTLFLYLENAVRTPSTCYFNKDETYSMDEMKEIVAYAEGAGLTVIPAFENLGHMEKFLEYDALKEFAECKNEEKDGRGWINANYPNGNNVCVSNEACRAFTDNYIREVASLFHSDYIHMGLDEVFEFASCKTCEARAKQSSKRQMFLEHVLHCHSLCSSLGKRMMMWDDFFEYFDVVADLPRDIVLCCWSYSFAGDEIPGHWTGRVKRDALRTYEQLGFSYLFCTWAPTGTSSYRMQALTEYAQKFHPMGAVMTMWECSDKFYLGSYPVIAYAAALWKGEATANDKAKIFERVLGDKELAELAAAMQIPMAGAGYGEIASLSECDYLPRLFTRSHLNYFLNKWKERLVKLSGVQKDIASDFYAQAYESYLNLEWQYLGKRYFDCVESMQKTSQNLAERAEEIKKGYCEIEEIYNTLWQKYRKGIPSCKNAMQNKFARYKAMCERNGAKLQNCDVGVLYLDAMLPEVYASVRAKIEVEYSDGEKQLVHKGGIKPMLDYFDVGGCYTLRMAIKNKPVFRVTLTVLGEGALYPIDVRALIHGKKYAAKMVVQTAGEVEHAEHLLKRDSSFASLGINDGKRHIEDVSLCRRPHSVTVQMGE